MVRREREREKQYSCNFVPTIYNTWMTTGSRCREFAFAGCDGEGRRRRRSSPEHGPTAVVYFLQKCANDALLASPAYWSLWSECTHARTHPYWFLLTGRSGQVRYKPKLHHQFRIGTARGGRRYRARQRARANNVRRIAAFLSARRPT
jgi:hypothetical protein